MYTKSWDPNNMHIPMFTAASLEVGDLNMQLCMNRKQDMVYTHQRIIQS